MELLKELGLKMGMGKQGRPEMWLGWSQRWLGQQRRWRRVEGLLDGEGGDYGGDGDQPWLSELRTVRRCF